MSIYKTCPICGANLDPGERCDCSKKTVVSAANADNGGTGNGMSTQLPTAHDTKKNGGISTMNAIEYSDTKKFYILSIHKKMERCNDISLLDLIDKLLCKSMQKGA